MRPFKNVSEKMGKVALPPPDRIVFDWIPVFTEMTTWSTSLRISIKVRFSSSATASFAQNDGRKRMNGGMFSAIPSSG